MLFEKKGKKLGQLLGKTPYMQSVYVEAPPELMGAIHWVEIQQGYMNSLTGRLKDSS